MGCLINDWSLQEHSHTGKFQTTTFGAIVTLATEILAELNIEITISLAKVVYVHLCRMVQQLCIKSYETVI